MTNQGKGTFMWRAVALFVGSAFAVALSGCVASGEPLSPPGEEPRTPEPGVEAEGTAAAPAQLSGWVKCADEHGWCVFSGKHRIAYGSNGIFNYLTNTGGIPCNNETFGDPVVGVFKACYVTD